APRRAPAGRAPGPRGGPRPRRRAGSTPRVRRSSDSSRRRTAAAWALRSPLPRRRTGAAPLPAHPQHLRHARPATTLRALQVGLRVVQAADLGGAAVLHARDLVGEAEALDGLGVVARGREGGEE